MHEIRCTGAILIGGPSSRMGTPKHTLEISPGRSFLDAIADALSKACERVVVVGDQPGSATSGYFIIPDRRGREGPLGGIEAILASGTSSQYLICPCDLPLIDAAQLRLLIQPSDAPATVFQVQGRQKLEPLPARISAAALPTVQVLLDSDVRPVWRLMAELKPEVVVIDAAQAQRLHNVNTRADYHDALRRLAGAK